MTVGSQAGAADEPGPIMHKKEVVQAHYFQHYVIVWGLEVTLEDTKACVCQHLSHVENIFWLKFDA